ncbi:MAG TPA: topoisomerase IV [Candidatus Egerieicola pullicola]|uniref:Topoisomerase IV n=1 Tax=Candidatus Egerieicola pullicola TaxID=2840775 RepID=A0A9D1AHB1_9FIRM|nr:topoisomerase IV [Candidatus Egerieicola pullicola]
MPRKKSQPEKKPASAMTAEIEGAGSVLDQPITQTIEQNYMPYAMSVIISRALPEIDGFKPSHRKILYTMYKMGLLTGQRTKSANIVGQTMRLNPHGDAAIYETMVRLSRGNESLLHPYVDSKGNFGKAFSRDMAYAASRYTEAKLEPICKELFEDIDKDTVDFVPNYDNTTTEPTLLPARFPSVLVNFNVGIAVSMASNICSFNLKEICDTTIALIRDPECDLHQTLLGPDFPGGGYLVHDKAALDQIYRTGRGSVKIRAKYRYDASANCIDILQIPPTTTVEAIMDKIVDLVKAGRLKEISDMRDETDRSGLKLTLDLKRGTDPDKLMLKLFKSTPLQDSFSANFNILIAGSPKVMGVREILQEWVAFRTECVKRRIYFELTKKKEKLHLLEGLQLILLDIDKAIRIVRQTEEETEVVPNLMIGFGIDQVQAEYVAEIKLRHLNREYILKRTAEVDQLREDIAKMEDTLSSKKKIQGVIIQELKQVAKEYGQPRKTQFLFDAQEAEGELEEHPDYAVHLFLTKEGYFKKVTPQSLRMSGEHKLKEGDEILQHIESTADAHLLFFTDHQQVYKSFAYEFPDTKVSLMGNYVAGDLGFEEGERVVAMAVTKDYAGDMLFFFDNGRVSKVPLTAYETKTKRKKLANAYCAKFGLEAAFQITEGQEFQITTTGRRVLLVHSDLIPEKTTRDTQGIMVLSLKKNQKIASVQPYTPGSLSQEHRYRAKTLPAAGALLKEEDTQATLF